MSDRNHLSRRTAIAGLGAGSLGMLLGGHAAAMPPLPNAEMGSAPDVSTGELAGHKLNGRWLSLIGLPSNSAITVAVPTIFGPDGTTVMIFPGVEAAKRGVEIRGVALGEWSPVGARAGRFTAVQVLASLEGGYVGTMTVDGYAELDDDDLHFAVRVDDNVFTLRNAANAITEHLKISPNNPMRGTRMSAGNPGFPAPAVPSIDPRTPF